MIRAWMPAAGLVLVLAGAAALAAGACGKGPTAPDPAPLPTGPTITITSGGATPLRIDIPIGGRLTIVNRDAVSHDMGSDPHPNHEDCPELNQIGMLAPGQQRTSGNLVEARTCGMHDHLRPLAATLQPRLTIK